MHLLDQVRRVQDQTVHPAFELGAAEIVGGGLE